MNNPRDYVTRTPTFRKGEAEGDYKYGPIVPCHSCGKQHDEAEAVVREDRVWYRCPSTHNLVYIRDVRK